MKKIISFLIIFLGLFLLVSPVSAKEKEKECKAWNLTGSLNINLLVNGDLTSYLEVANLTQTGTSLTGSFTYNGGSRWVISSGSVVGKNINFNVYYDTNPTMTAHFIGVIANEGTMSGIWADTAGMSRTGTWSTTDKVKCFKGDDKKGEKDNENKENRDRKDDEDESDNHHDLDSEDNHFSCKPGDWKINPAVLQVDVTYSGNWDYTAKFVRSGTALTGSMTDPYVTLSPLTGPVTGNIKGNHVVFAFDYGSGSVQGIRTYTGDITPVGDLVGKWSQAGSQSTGQLFDFVIAKFATKCVKSD